MERFPTTRVSLIAALSSDDAETRARAIDVVAAVYREPIIAVVRHRWSLSLEDAEDLAHDFLVQALTREWLLRYDPARGRFRTFLRSCLLAFASTRYERETRLKRGGGVTHLSLDDADAQLSGDAEVDAIFEREWVRSVLECALQALRQECERVGREVTYAVFMRHDVEGAELAAPPSYAELGRWQGIPVTQVTNYLNWARRRFRAHVLETLHSLTATEEEFRHEARVLLGIDVP